MKKIKVILWAVFAVAAICLTVVGIDAVRTGNLHSAIFSFLMIMGAFLSVIELSKWKIEGNGIVLPNEKPKSKNWIPLAVSIIMLLIAIHIGFRLLSSDLNTMETWRFWSFVISACIFLLMALAGIIGWIWGNKKAQQEINIE